MRSTGAPQYGPYYMDHIIWAIDLFPFMIIGHDLQTKLNSQTFIFIQLVASYLQGTDTA